MKKLLSAFTLLAAALSFTGCATAGTAATGAGTESGGIIMIVVYVVVIGVAMYFIAIRPQKKQQKEQASMLSQLQVGDTVLTTSGFYGVIIDITEDTVIVEFGNNKSCRIPMQKSAIVQSEHPDAQ